MQKAKEKSKKFEESKAEEKSVHKVVEQKDTEILDKEQSFEKLGVCSEICEAIEKMGYKHPSKI